MAASEDDIIRDQNERDNLQKVIASAESAMADSAPGTGTRRVLENLVEQARKRVTVLEKKIEESTRERETAAAEQVAMAARLAEKEARLNEEEKKTFSGFLAKEFFTKKDFGKLENFYAHSWDRLSERGKDEMSRRFWKGIERGEYTFDDAPAVMQRKEAERAREHLGLNELSAPALAKLPNEQQRAFASAYEKGNNDDALRILKHGRNERDDEQSLRNRDQASTKGRNASLENPTKTAPKMEKLDPKSLNLDGIELGETEAVTKPAVAALAASTMATRQC